MTVDKCYLGYFDPVSVTEVSLGARRINRKRLAFRIGDNPVECLKCNIQNLNLRMSITTSTSWLRRSANRSS